MAQLNESETAMLLLCGDMDDGCRPCGIRDFRELSKRALASDMDMSQRDVKQSDFTRLGYDEEEAERLFSLISRETKMRDRLEKLADVGIFPLTRISADYPREFWQKLSDSAPVVLFYAGNIELLNNPKVSLVGPRDLFNEGSCFASKVGNAAASEGLTLVSGGANGADAAGEAASIQSGGTVISIIADSIYHRAKEKTAMLSTGRYLMLSQSGPFLAFSVARAQSRNRLIHALSDRVFVAGAEFEKGGSWSGTYDNLKHGYSNVFVLDDGTRGTSALITIGGSAIKTEDVRGLQDLEPTVISCQQRLF